MHAGFGLAPLFGACHIFNASFVKIEKSCNRLQHDLMPILVAIEELND